MPRRFPWAVLRAVLECVVGAHAHGGCVRGKWALAASIGGLEGTESGLLARPRDQGPVAARWVALK